MKLQRTTQCAKCPWKKSVDPRTIPNGYDVEKHRALKATIADANDPGSSIGARALRVMACHETHDAHCVGWLANQLGRGNNIALRIQMLQYENAKDIRTTGEQHERFENTLPKDEA